MSESSSSNRSSTLPGMEFLQQSGLGAQATGSSGLSSWVIPTVNVEELSKCIQDLRSVLFWLEQNVLGVKTAIQVLEVQKMTLTTLQGMNVSLSDMAKAFTLPTDNASASANAPTTWPYAEAITSQPKGQQEAEQTPVALPDVSPETPSSASSAAAHLPDPMQWWGALVQQFQSMATQAVQASSPSGAPEVAAKSRQTQRRQKTLKPSPAERKSATPKKTVGAASKKRSSAAKARKSTMSKQMLPAASSSDLASCHRAKQ